MAFGHIDLEKIKANREQNESPEKKELEELKLQSDAIAKLYEDKEQIDNSDNTER